MEANCNAHTKPAFIYCVDHAMLCCEDECYDTHSKHNTVTIKKYKKACTSFTAYNQLKQIIKEIVYMEALVSRALDNVKYKFKSQLNNLSSGYYGQLYSQLSKRSKEMTPLKSELKLKFTEIIAKVNSFCSEIAIPQYEVKPKELKNKKITTNKPFTKFDQIRAPQEAQPKKPIKRQAPYKPNFDVQKKAAEAHPIVEQTKFKQRVQDNPIQIAPNQVVLKPLLNKPENPKPPNFVPQKSNEILLPIELKIPYHPVQIDSNQILVELPKKNESPEKPPNCERPEANSILTPQKELEIPLQISPKKTAVDPLKISESPKTSIAEIARIQNSPKVDALPKAKENSLNVTQALPKIKEDSSNVQKVDTTFIDTMKTEIANQNIIEVNNS